MAVKGGVIVEERIKKIFEILINLKDIKLVHLVESLIEGYIEDEKNKSL